MKTFKILLLLFIIVFLIYPAGVEAIQSESSIVKIDGNEIYINWGSHDGITRGMVFNVYRSKERIHPETGEPLDKEQGTVGSIKIIEVFPEYSIGRLQTKMQEPRVGDYLELVINSGGESMDTGVQQGTVMSMDKGKVEISIGSADGIQEGLLFDVMRDMVLKHPVTGELLDKREYLIGKISVSSVNRNSSVCDVLSGWEDISTGDKIVLSEKQRSDMGIETAQSGMMQPMVQESELAQLISAPQPRITMPKYFGKVVSVNKRANTAVFSWDKGVDENQMYQGSDVGIYRKEKVVHPITKAEIGTPEVLIGSGSYIRTVKGRGELKILKTDSPVKKGDIVGLSEVQQVVSGQTRKAGTPVGRRVNLRDEAERLTQEVINIQDDIDELKALKRRLSSVERSVASQRKMTAQLQKDVKAINDKLTLLVEGGGGSLIPSQTTTMELYGAHPEDIKTYRIKYTDDIDVKLQFQDKVLYVSLDVDSVKTKGMTAAVREEEMPLEETSMEGVEQSELVDMKEIEGETMEVSKPFYIKYLFQMIGGVVLLAVLFFVFTFLKKKGGDKKKPVAESDELDFEEADEEDLEELEEETIE